MGPGSPHRGGSGHAPHYVDSRERGRSPVRRSARGLRHCPLSTARGTAVTCRVREPRRVWFSRGSVVRPYVGASALLEVIATKQPREILRYIVLKRSTEWSPKAS